MRTRGEVRAGWLKQLLSTEPADRPSAEAAVRDLYVAGGFAPPSGFLWFESPFEASWAVALLLASHNQTWRDRLASAAKVRDGRERLDRMRSTLSERLNQSDWESVLRASGNTLNVMLRFPVVAPKSLHMEIVSARLSMHDDVSAVVGQVPDDSLEHAESQLWKGSRGVLMSELHCPTTSSLVGHSFFSEYSFSMMADDEAQVGDRQPPPILSAAWRTGRCVGLWWPFTGVAILSDRPSELHVDHQNFLHSGDGPAAIYRDGSRVYAWEGIPLPAKWILEPKTIPPRDLKGFRPSFRQYIERRVGTPSPKQSSKSTRRRKRSAILSTELPAGVAARLERLREHAEGRLPMLERYQTGAYREVWSELVALGPDVREDPQAADALAVASETMRRVAINIRTLMDRLRAMNYAFATDASRANAWMDRAGSVAGVDLDRLKGAASGPQISTIFDIARRARDILAGQIARQKTVARDSTVKAHVAPTAETWKRIGALEKGGRMPPLSLRAFYEIVGSVDLMGSHPTLAPSDGAICPDPLVVYGADDAVMEMESEDDDDEDEPAITIAPDDLHKADTSGGDPYQIAVPDLRADGELLNERHHLFFVDYLRLCFQFGGFPGYEGAEDVPREIEVLREGLLEF